jgi:hypothetical protein
LIQVELKGCLSGFFDLTWIKMELEMILEQKFTLASIAEVVEKNPTTLRTHINRGLVTAQGPRNINGDSPPGKHSRFSFFTLMEFVLAYHLYDEIGLQLDKSFKHARGFAHVSGGGDVFQLPTRDPALPFHHEHGYTLWGIGHDRSFEIPTESEAGKNLYVMMRHYLHTEDFILLNASSVFNRVCGKLSLHPYEVLDQVYKDPRRQSAPVGPERVG